MSPLGTRIAIGALAILAVDSAVAGAVVDQFRGGAFGLAWNAGGAAIETRYPGGRWDQDDRRPKALLRGDAAVAAQAAGAAQDARDLLPGGRRTARSRARPPASSPHCPRCSPSSTAAARFSAISTRSSATKGSVQSRFTYMLWTRDRPYLVQVGSTNDADGRPSEVTFTVADDAALHTGGADSVSHRPVAQNH